MKVYNEHCNCVLYYMPRPHRNMKICGRTDSECVDKVRLELQLAMNDGFQCDFPYGFNAIKYDMSLSSIPIFDRAPILKKNHLLYKNAAILHVYYQSTFYRSENKQELIGFTEFLCKHILIYFFIDKFELIFNKNYSHGAHSSESHGDSDASKLNKLIKEIMISTLQ